MLSELLVGLGVEGSSAFPRGFLGVARNAACLHLQKFFSLCLCLQVCQPGLDRFLYRLWTLSTALPIVWAISCL